MLTIHYREAGIDDKPIVYELMQELIKELSSDSSVKEFLEKLETDIDIALSRDDIVFILAELGDEVIGLKERRHSLPRSYLSITLRNPMCYIDQMYVRPKHRRGGVGGGLYRSVNAG